MQLKDIMTSNVESVSTTTPLSEAARLMATHDVGFLPVIDSNGVVGVVTDRDIMIRAIADGADPNQTHVGTVMTRDVHSLSEDTSVEEGARLMKKKQIRRLLVKGSNDRIVGVVSLGDLAIKCHDSEMEADTLEKISEPVHA